MSQNVIIIGAGPAGLTAGYMLIKKNIPTTVLEGDPVYVGGIARTIIYKGYHFDIGGHRFFSKSKIIEDLWTEILGTDLIERPRASRIFYKGKFYSYPLKIWEVLKNLGIIESFLCVLSYVKAALLPIKNPKKFNEWVTNHFGKRLFSIFFKTYTEKVWGMSCDEISADWAAQRIQGLSLISAIKNAIFSQKTSSGQKSTIKTLINSFRYPRKGPGMLWERCANIFTKKGGNLYLGSNVIGLHYHAHSKIWDVTYQNSSGETNTIQATHVISSAPLRELILNYLKNDVPPAIQQAAQQLKYRDFLIVALILKDKKQLKDNWIYIHDPKVDVARIQNFKSWSEEMVPDASMCCYGLEYFCHEKDNIWDMADEDLIQKAKKELSVIGLANSEDVIDGCVIRQVKAYPVYDDDYKKRVNLIRSFLQDNLPTLYLVGRNGMHKYNNQDHAMMTAMLTVKNILLEKQHFNVWLVNQDAEYIESGDKNTSEELGLRSVPEKIKESV